LGEERLSRIHGWHKEKQLAQPIPKKKNEKASNTLKMLRTSTLLRKKLVPDRGAQHKTQLGRKRIISGQGPRRFGRPRKKGEIERGSILCVGESKNFLSGPNLSHVAGGHPYRKARDKK